MELVKVKSVLTIKNELNIYRGCAYGCIYCDAKMKSGLKEVECRTNAPELLSLELSDKHEKKMITIGNLGDPYNPYEESLGLTRDSLRVIDHFGFGATIYTKSNLILRDLDLLKNINKKAKCVVVMYISSSTDEMGKRLEEKASLISERILALKRLKEEGIPTVISISPLLPYINDTESNLKKILEIAKDCECKGIIYRGPGIMLRDGSKNYFYESLSKSYPILKRRYLREFKGKNLLEQACNVSSFDYIIKDFCSKNNLIYDLDDISYYLSNFDVTNLQLSLFNE